MADFPPDDDVCGALEEHVRRYFAGHEIEPFIWDLGPIQSVNAHFRVLRIAPVAPHGVWVYVSVGGWAATENSDHGLEFILATQQPTPRAVELLAMTVYYNQGGKLGLGHTVPIGEPWLPGSVCDHLLISLPYPWGPALEKSHVGDRHVDFLWLLPISEEERQFKAADGLDALETLFDNTALKYWDATRASVL